MKRNVSIILIALMLFSLIPINLAPIVGADNPNGEIIDGEGCYWENDWGRLEVYPRISQGEIHQEQFCNATWKLAANDLDIAFRFNDSLIDAHVYEWTGSEWNEVTSAFKHTIYNNKHYYYVESIHFEQDETRRFKWNYDVPFNSSGKWDFMAKLSSESIQYALDNNRYVMLDPGWYGDWLFSTKVTINAAQVEGDLLNFPVMYPMNASQSAKANSGNSVRFLDAANETVYYHERDNDDWDSGGTNVFWVNITSIDSAVDTVFYVFYGNGGVSDSEDPDNTWDDNYLAVYHMNNESGTIPNHAVTGTDDLICNYRSGPDEVTGKIGNALDYESADQDGSLKIDTNNYKSIGNITVESWAKFETLAGNRGLVAYADQIGVAWDELSWDWEYVFHVTTPTMAFMWSTGSGAGVDEHADAKGITTGKWYYLTATYKDATAVKHYFNGSWQITDNSVTAQYDPTNCNLSIGYQHQWTGGGSWMDGLLDEIRISNIIRNNSWINTTFININQTDVFLTIGGELGEYPGFHTNTTTNITRTSATFNAYLSSDGYNYDGTYTTGFWFGTNTPPTDADSNQSYGDIILSGTGIHFDLLNTSLVENTGYHVKAWAFNGTTFFESNSTDSFTTLQSPQPPTNVQSNILDNNSLEVTWDTGIASNRTVIIRKVGSYSSTPHDGTEVFNNSDEDFYAEDITGNYFYRMWGWNGTFGEYSSDYANVEYGVLLLSCFNESNPTEALTFDILIKNTDGTDVFNGSGLTNIHTVDISDIPFGNNTQMIVNSFGYNQRIYYFDLTENNVFNISFYLPFANISELYLLHVEDRAEQSLDLVKIQVQRYINTTGVYENVSIVRTDGAGDTLVNLIPNIPYQVILSKELYVTQIADYTTSPDLFVKNFVMDRTEDVENVTKFLDTIIFTGEWILSNNTLHIHYFDKEDNTINTAFQIWEVGNFTEFLNATYEFTIESDIHIYVSGLNLNRTHRIEIDLNHTTIGQIVNQPIYVYPAFKPDVTIRDLSWLEQLFGDNYGDFELGYVNFFLIFLPCLSIIIVFAKHPGLGVLGSASYITFISWYIEITLALLGVASLLFTIGIIIIIVKKGKKVTT